jgi:hypothetical protein
MLRVNTWCQSQQHVTSAHLLLQNRLALIVKTFPPSLFKKGHPKDTDYYQDLGIRVPEWGHVRRTRHTGLSRGSSQVGRDRVIHQSKSDPDSLRGSTPKITKAAKLKGQASGRTYTSKFRGVHQTFPTRRWEAQFRKNGKPTSLGELQCHFSHTKGIHSVVTAHARRLTAA